MFVEMSRLVRKPMRLVYIFGVYTARKLLRRFHLPPLFGQSDMSLADRVYLDIVEPLDAFLELLLGLIYVVAAFVQFAHERVFHG